MDNPIKLSALVLAHGEFDVIDGTLSSLGFADEIVVLDTSGDQKTRKIIRKFTKNIHDSSEKDFSRLRNILARYARGRWLLYVDADEIVSPELQSEIRDKVERSTETMPVAFEIDRQTWILGYPWPTRDKAVRFMRKSALKTWYGALHESADIDGEVGALIHPLQHDTHRTLSDMVRKTNIWSDVEARLRFESHHPRLTWWRFLRVIFTGFIDSYVKQQGWRAGVVGLIEGIYQAFSMFITYAKLWELQKNHEKNR